MYEFGGVPSYYSVHVLNKAMWIALSLWEFYFCADLCLLRGYCRMSCAILRPSLTYVRIILNRKRAKVYN